MTQGVHHLTWQQVVSTRCTAASKWAAEAAKLNPEEDPTSVQRALRLAIEDLEVAEARLLSSVQVVPEKRKKAKER